MHPNTLTFLVTANTDSPCCSIVLGYIFRRLGQEYWNEKPFPSPGDFPNSEIESRSPALQADSLPSEPPGKLPQ